MALHVNVNSLFCADVSLSNYSLTPATVLPSDCEVKSHLDLDYIETKATLWKSVVEFGRKP